MRIGIDARPLCKPMIGSRRVLGAILKEWAKSGARGHEIVLYAPRPFEDDFGSAFQRRIGKLGRFLGGSFWLQTELPFMAAKDQLDVFFGSMEAVPLALAGKVPTACMVHDLGFYEIPETYTPYMRLVYRLFFRRSLRAADRLVSTTGAVRGELGKLGYGGKTDVVFFGVDADKFAPPAGARAAELRGRHGLPSDYFLYIGHLRPNKNLERTLDAFERFSEALPEGAKKPTLVLAGGRTSTDAAIFERLNRPALKERCRYLGYVADDEIASLFSGALAFVSPSIYEGFGLPYLEAMAAGLPVVAPGIATCREVCAEAALYVDPQDTDSIRSAFGELWTSEARRKELAAASRRRAESLSWSASANKLLDILEDAA